MSDSDHIENFLENYKNMHAKFINFIENEENIEENFNNLTQIIEDAKIRECQHKLRLFLYMLIQIANDHYRGPNFFSKIKRTLQLFKDDIKKSFTDSQIFRIFMRNKRILLFVIEEKFLTKISITELMKIFNHEFEIAGYPQYFAREFKSFLNSENIEKITKDFPDNYSELRNEGENESHICKLIREDAIKDFIVYVNKNSISLNSTITQSIFETNSFLLNEKNRKNGIHLIEYAAFFGSIQIFTYLKNEGVKLNSSLWYYAIHGENSAIIHLLEDNHVIAKTTVLKGNYEVESFEGCFKESIKCHHNEIANFLLNNYMTDLDENSDKTFTHSLAYYNFSFLKNEKLNESSFCQLCHYDYYPFVKILLTRKDININDKEITIIEIQNHIFE